MTGCGCARHPTAMTGLLRRDRPLLDTGTAFLGTLRRFQYAAWAGPGTARTC